MLKKQDTHTSASSNNCFFKFTSRLETGHWRVSDSEVTSSYHFVKFGVCGGGSYYHTYILGLDNFIL